MIPHCIKLTYIGIMAMLFIPGCRDQEDQSSDVKPSEAVTSNNNNAEKSPSPVILDLIVFSSNRSGSWKIWSVKPDGTRLQQLTTGAPEDQDVDPSISPDGTTVLFSSTRGGNIGIWKTPLANPENTEKICEGDQAEWSPDGKHIAFRREEKIIIRNIADGSEKTITPMDWPHCSGPTWSPDGDTLAFASRWEAGNAVFTVPARGGQPTKVYDKKGACEPHYAPDGNLLVYETETNVCTIEPNGAKNRPVTYFGGVQRYPCFSPDGKKIIYCQGVSENGPWELYTIPAAGGAPTKLLEGDSDMSPHWK